MSGALPLVPTVGWSAPDRRTLLTRRQVRVAVGVLWLIDAALQAQPHLFGANWWRDDLAQSVMGQPAPVARSILWVVQLVAAHAGGLNAAFVATEAALGLCLITGRFERAAIVASVPWSLGIWWAGEGFGTLPTGFALFAAGAPGPVLFYVLLAMLAWPRRDPEVPTRWAAGCWAALWTAGALLLAPWQFSPGRVIQANLNEFSLGQRSGLGNLAEGAYHLAGSHPATFAVLLGVTQAAVGLGVLYRPGRRIALAGGMALSLVFWGVFQAFGGIPAGNATDPGAAPLLVLLGLAMWPAGRSACRGGHAATILTPSPDGPELRERTEASNSPRPSRPGRRSTRRSIRLTVASPSSPPIR